jgi:DNA-binding response OmpR family regulator
VPRIAVLENDPTLLDLLGEIFAEQGWELLPHTSSTVVPALQQEKPDLILLDLWLEGVTTGWDVLQQLKQDPATRSTPVIVMSAAADHLREMEPCLAEQGIPAIEKPFDVDDLCATIRAALEHRRPDLQGREAAADRA